MLAHFVFITGDLASPEAAAFSLRCRQPIVRKPFDFQELETEIARVLGHEPSGSPSARAPVAMPLAVLLLVSASVGCGPSAAPEPSSAAGAAPPLASSAGAPDAPALYAQHCALCHGASGDGDGVVRLDRPARSFRAGGFSFGNTEEAIYRTITHGIGGSPMPGFQTLLGDAERRALARHVIALGPEGPPAAGAESILAVGVRPAIVRGQLAPLVPGGPEFQRALLVGNPDGMSFAYRADDLRLLAVYQGPFVDRKDWGERGGLPLEPLGRRIFLAAAGGDPAPEWHAAGLPLHARLLSTSFDRPGASLRYALAPAEGAALATVEESCRAVAYAAGSGFVRSFAVAATGSDSLRFVLPFEAAAEPEDASWLFVRGPGQALAVRVRDSRRVDVGQRIEVEASARFTVEAVVLAEPAREAFLKLTQEAR